MPGARVDHTEREAGELGGRDYSGASGTGARARVLATIPVSNDGTIKNETLD